MADGMVVSESSFHLFSSLSSLRTFQLSLSMSEKEEVMFKCQMSNAGKNFVFVRHQEPKLRYGKCHFFRNV